MGLCYVDVELLEALDILKTIWKRPLYGDCPPYTEDLEAIARTREGDSFKKRLEMYRLGGSGYWAPEIHEQLLANLQAQQSTGN